MSYGWEMKFLRLAAFAFFFLFLAITFLVSGLLINLVQFVLFKTLYETNRRLYRKINYYLHFTIWSQLIFIQDWWSGSPCTLYADEETLAKFGKEKCIVIMNHKFDTDWCVWMNLCNYFRAMGNAKTFVKKSLRFLPLIGWSSLMSEGVFLDRDWEKDRTELERQLDNYAEYEDPVMLVLYCEGTRWTPEKHEASMKFAESRNLPPLKHHLYPRAKGFAFTAKHLKDKFAAVYNLQVAMPDTVPKPCFTSMLFGHRVRTDAYLKRTPMEHVPTDSEKDATDWLYRHYQEKDKLAEDYESTKKFPGKPIEMKRSIRTLLNESFWAVTVGMPVYYFILKILLQGSMVGISAGFTVIVLVFTSAYLMLKYGLTGKGSTYGKAKVQNRE